MSFQIVKNSNLILWGLLLAETEMIPEPLVRVEYSNLNYGVEDSNLGSQR